MSLETYRRKRDFGRTPEPAGAPERAATSSEPTGSRRFVVQRHRATRLHYDFRLEIDGVLVSWAVPKGPTHDPSVKRMAVHVEDHPLEYFDFEGIIPKGQYGGGDVIVWDWGTWEPEETADPARAVRKGELKFRLEGQKLRGRWTIVRTGYGDQGDGKEQWLLLHKKDEHAEAGWDAEDHPRSVKTGRTNDEVKAGAPAIWDSHAPAASAAIDLSAAVEAPMPEFVEPMKATLGDRPFTDEDWLFEVKWDGYRVQARVERGQIRLWTRGQQDAARYFPDLAGPPDWIAADEAIVDGEVVAFNESGDPDFSLLQDRTGIRGVQASDGRAPGRSLTRDERAGIPIQFLCFDLLYHDGRSLLDVPLDERKQLLKLLLRDHPLVRYASHIAGEGEAFHEAARQRGLEGVVAKHRRSRYEPGRRSKHWLKLKIRREQELAVCGYLLGQGTHADLGSLIVGVYEDGKLRHAGQVGSGLDGKTRRWFRERLDATRRETAPFDHPVRIRDARWVEPTVVIRAEFAEWTSDGLLRQAAFKGIDPEKDPRAVVREIPSASDRMVEESEAEVARGEAERAKTAQAQPPQPKARAQPKAAQVQPTRSRARGRAVAAGVAEASGGSVPATTPVGSPAQAATAEELAALDAFGKAGKWLVGGYEVTLSNLDKVLFPDAGYTKRDLIRYYVAVAPVMLPYLRDRALNLWRWPDGVTGGHFWQKEIPAYAPEWMARWSYPEAESSEAHTYIVADRVAAMAWLANHATIDMHAWTSRIDGYKTPTYALIDVDPGTRTSWEEVLLLTRLYRTALEHLGVAGFPKVTGKRGIQIWVPIERRYTFDQTRAWVEGISRAVGGAVPDLVSWEWEKRSRKGLARLDYTQNAVNKTLVAPYAVRPVGNAAVSAPIRWEELDDPELRPDRWDIRSIFERLDREGDLFRGVLEVEQPLPSL